MEIIRDLRLGEFDVLVGINYCAKVWICRKCRWWRSSTLKRRLPAFRTFVDPDHWSCGTNVNGKAILYGDKITPSMAKALAKPNVAVRNSRSTTRNTEYAARLEQESGRYPGAGAEHCKTKAKGRGKSRPIVEPDNVPWICRLKRCSRKSMSWKG